MSEAGLVSTIIPVFNRAAMLEEAVASVLAQTYRPIEVLIVDDGSTDTTVAVAAQLASSHPSSIRVLTQINAGPGAARNQGLREARGEFVQYLDSDDLLLPTKFELQVAALRANPDTGLCYGKTRRRDVASGTEQIWARTGEHIAGMFPDFLNKRGWDTNAPLWRRSACDQVGPWLSLRCMEDWEHDLRAGMLGVVPVRVDAEVAIIRDHAGVRASGADTGFSVAILADFLRAHEHVWARMQAQGLLDWIYLREFSRKLFWIARMCGAAGMVSEATRALAIAEAMTRVGEKPVQIQLYRRLVAAVGWARASKLIEWLSESQRWLRGVVRTGNSKPVPLASGGR